MNMLRDGTASFVRAQAVSKEFFDVFGDPAGARRAVHAASTTSRAVPTWSF